MEKNGMVSKDTPQEPNKPKKLSPTVKQLDNDFMKKASNTVAKKHKK